MSKSTTRFIVLRAAAVAGVVGLAGTVNAHISSSMNCIGCHAPRTDIFELVDAQRTQGGLKVYQVRSGESVPIGINVTNAPAENAVNFYMASAAGVTNANNTFVFAPDAGWTLRTSGGTHYTKGINTVTRGKYVYAMAVSAPTPPDLYRAVVQVAGSPGKIAQKLDFYVEVLPAVIANRPPTMTPVGDRTVEAGQLLALTVTAQDPDVPAQVLTFRLGAGAPSGAVITAGGAFTWTPTAQQGGSSYPVSVIVTDNGSPALSATNTFNVTVTRPAIQPPSVTQVSLAGGKFGCSVATVAGVTYYLEFKATLGGGSSWTTVDQVIGDGTTRSLQDPNAAGVLGFYQVRAQ